MQDTNLDRIEKIVRRILIANNRHKDVDQILDATNDILNIPPPYDDRKLLSEIIYSSIISQLSRLGIDIDDPTASEIEQAVIEYSDPL